MDNTSGIQSPNMFQMPNMGGAAGNAFSGITGLNTFGNLGSGVLPAASSTANSLYNNPFASLGLGGATDAANLGRTGAMTGFGLGQGFTGLGSNLQAIGSNTMTAGQNMLGAGNPFIGAGNQLIGTGQQVGGMGNQLVPYAAQELQTGMDPQSALYNRTLQQVQDQSRAANEARGIDSSPYGAGLENQATSNFNIDWQNQQLARQLQAGQGATGLLSGAAGIANTGAGIEGLGGGLASTGAGINQTGANITGTGANILGQGAGLQQQGVNMMNQAPGELVQSAMLPYATYSDIGQGQFGALGSLLGLGGQGEGLANLPIQDLLGYLGVGNQAGQVANQNFSDLLKQAQQSWTQQGQFGQGIGSMLGMIPGMGWLSGLGNLFGGGGSGELPNMGFASPGQRE